MSADTSATFFEAKYRDGVDPWDFAGNAYENARYDAIARALRAPDGLRRYRSAFEPGCSVGVLSARLADFCDAVEAIDFAPSAIATAVALRSRPNLVYGVATLRDRLPLYGFDLVVLSEIGYYFTPVEWSGMIQSMVDSALSGTTFLAAHWLGHSPDHRMSGDGVHAVLRAQPRLHLQHEERHAGFRLDRWECRE